MSYLPFVVKWTSIILVSVCIFLILRRGLKELYIWASPAGRATAATLAKAEQLSNHRMSSRILWKQLLGLFFVSRLIMILASLLYAAYHLKPDQNYLYAVAQWWFEYDSYHYVHIAQFGYEASGEHAKLIVFYPLYPLLVHLVSWLIPDYYAAGFMVSNLFMLVAMFGLVRLMELDWPKDRSLDAAKYMVLFPFSFFFSMVYTESVFIALCIWCFYYLRTSRWFLAGVLALLAALTRNQGVLLAIPIIVELIAQRGWLGNPPVQAGRLQSSYKTIQVLLMPLMPVLGIGIYLLINRIVTGDWFRFLYHQKDYWHQTFGFFPDHLAEFTHRAITYNKPLFTTGVYLPQIILFMLSFLLLIYMVNKTRFSYLLFSFAYLIISYSASALLSGARYIGGMFTLYLFMACLFGRLSNMKRTYVDWMLLFFLLFYTVILGLNHVF